MCKIFATFKLIQNSLLNFINSSRSDPTAFNVSIVGNDFSCKGLAASFLLKNISERLDNKSKLITSKFKNFNFSATLISLALPNSRKCIPVLMIEES